MLLFCLYLVCIDFVCQSQQTFSLHFFFFWRLKIQQYNHVQALFQITWRTLKPVHKTKAIHSQWSVECALTIHTRLLTLLQCRHNIFTLPFPSVLCSADAHTGIGKAIVSNCNAQDFDYTLALKAQHCKRTIAQRAPSSRRCNFSPFLMREHIKR